MKKSADFILCLNENTVEGLRKGKGIGEKKGNGCD
jgi:hypothetical protein